MSEERFLGDAERTAQWIAAYRRRLNDLPVLPRVLPGDVTAALPLAPPEEPEALESVLSDLDDVIVPGLTHWNHPGFFAYFCSSTTDAGVLAEFLAAELNQNAMLWRTSPAATELERRTVDWVRHFVGLPDDFEGLILDTASSSSFTALLAARDQAVPDVRQRGLAGRSELGPCILYLSQEAHSSVDKAALAAGLGLDQVRHVPVDERFRMVPAELEKAIIDDRAAGRTPVMVCATIGTTSTTSVDPVREVAEICERLGVWLHVDAAYAGPAAALPEKRGEFDGWERADSIVLNPHKWMSTPIDCSILLYRNAEAMRRPLQLTPEYLRSAEDGSNLMDIGLSLGRRFRALKLWFQFRLEGVEGLRARLRSHIAIADELAGWIEEDPRFEVSAPHPFSLVVFRAIPPPDVESDEWNRGLLEAVNRGGRVFLSHTTVGGRYVIRLAVGSARGTEESVREAWSLLVEEYDRMAHR
ncbi:MAG: aminotransferase class V-fold PLP-dependent enzyme [Gemmatimonadetes bacterium]|nr:aminotransferase class V-fold PLP-dependent enzyme [Gemmatimonadota bacterium]